MVNFGHSNDKCRKIIVCGLVKYKDNVARDSLPQNDVKYKPLYLIKNYNETERQLSKMALKETYYKVSYKDQSWRKQIGTRWRLHEFTQRKVPTMEYTTGMEIPNTPGSQLLKNFTCVEPKLAKTTKHQVKFLEQSGIKLASLFQRKMLPKRCAREDCEVLSQQSKLCKRLIGMHEDERCIYSNMFGMPGKPRRRNRE